MRGVHRLSLQLKLWSVLHSQACRYMTSDKRDADHVCTDARPDSTWLAVGRCPRVESKPVLTCVTPSTFPGFPCFATPSTFPDFPCFVVQARCSRSSSTTFIHKSSRTRCNNVNIYQRCSATADRWPMYTSAIRSQDLAATQGSILTELKKKKKGTHKKKHIVLADTSASWTGLSRPAEPPGPPRCRTSRRRCFPLSAARPGFG